jgi:caffeoyl-CoA O-methyltransferase
MASDLDSPWLDSAIAAYCGEHTTPPDDVLQDLAAETVAALGGAAIMQIAPEQGVLLGMLVRLSGATRAVEVGTFTGYSALCIARALGDGGRLLCCDVNEEWTAMARRYWERGGVADRIDLRIGPALDTLRDLPTKPSFDLAFIDADKASYAAYYEELLPRLRRGGLLAVDNTLWSGRILDPEAQDPDTVAIRAFNDRVASDERVTTVLLPIADGLTLVQKR